MWCPYFIPNAADLKSPQDGAVAQIKELLRPPDVWDHFTGSRQGEMVENLFHFITKVSCKDQQEHK